MRGGCRGAQSRTWDVPVSVTSAWISALRADSGESLKAGPVKWGAHRGPSLLQGPGRLRDGLHLRGLPAGPSGGTASSARGHLPPRICQAGEGPRVSALALPEQVVRKDAPSSTVGTCDNAGVLCSAAVRGQLGRELRATLETSTSTSQGLPSAGAGDCAEATAAPTGPLMSQR